MIAVSEETKYACCGCTACAQICPVQCIAMKADREGFLYPEADAARCIGCNRCERVCPVRHPPEADARPKAYAVRSPDGSVLEESTSGGAFTALAQTVVRRGGVVFGGGFNDDFDVVHDCAETEEGLSRFRGSKYVQSELGSTFQRVKGLLDGEKPVLFSGTPCQAAGLRNFLGKPDPNLILVDLACHGVPSPLLWKKSREFLKKTYRSDLKKVQFRKKKYGYHHSVMGIEFENGRTYDRGGRTDFMLRSFFGEICSRPSCYRCAFKQVRRVSDITLFDCWHVDRLAEGKRDDDRGWTAVLVQSEKGARCLEEAAAAGSECIPVDLEALLADSGVMVCHSAVPHPRREEFFRLLSEGTAEDAVTGLIPVKRTDRFWERLKPVLYAAGMLGARK